MRDRRHHIAIIAGSVARAAGYRIEDCNHPEGSPRWHLWRLGFDGPADETVPRETSPSAVKHTGRRRGGSQRGPKPGWTGDQIALLRRCLDEDVPLDLITRICGHSYAATRTKIHRIRQEEAREAA